MVSRSSFEVRTDAGLSKGSCTLWKFLFHICVNAMAGKTRVSHFVDTFIVHLIVVKFLLNLTLLCIQFRSYYTSNTNGSYPD